MLLCMCKLSPPPKKAVIYNCLVEALHFGWNSTNSKFRLFCLSCWLILCHERLIYSSVHLVKTRHWSKIMFTSLFIFPNPLPTYMIITQLVIGSRLAFRVIKWSSLTGHQNFGGIRVKGETDNLFCELCSSINVFDRQFISSALLVFLLKVLQLIYIYICLLILLHVHIK